MGNSKLYAARAVGSEELFSLLCMLQCSWIRDGTWQGPTEKDMVKSCLEVCQHTEKKLVVQRDVW